MDAGGYFVFGEGTPRSIMFIGDAPGEIDAYKERAFAGPSGELVRGIMAKLNCSTYYTTTLVSCRSCTPSLAKETGLPIIKKINGVPTPMYRDSSPLPTEIGACRARLLEEIYLVDPVVIVTLGVSAAETLMGHPVTITRDRGRPEHIQIPGKTCKPSLTETRQVWGRKKGGVVTYPTLPNMLSYLVLPTTASSFVINKRADLTERGPFNNFLNDLKLAVRIYEKYLIEVMRVEPGFTHDADFTEMEALYAEEG